jgi:lipoyl(octanoyl) transferase
LRVEDLGIVTYEDAHRAQEARVAARVRGEAEDTLLLLEHPPVITLGRGTDPRNLRDSAHLPVVEAERGGDVTLHAPGQVVGYVIRLLPPGERDLHAHLRLLEAIVIQALERFGIAGERLAGKTGVWVSSRKIASLGVACRSWCTWHGFALNVDLPLDLFDAINPCGFPAAVMTSMARELGTPVAVPDVKIALADAARQLLVR